MKKLDINNFESFTSDNEMCLLDFYTNWCQPCKQMTPILDDISKDIAIGKINVEEDSSIARKFKVMSVPTILVFKGNEVVERINGLVSKEHIIDVLRKYS